MTATEYKAGLTEDAALCVGRPVIVRWGYGSGFRAQGRGEIITLYAKSVRVRLLEDVRGPGGSAGWPAGFVLHGIPRFTNERWHGEHCVLSRAATEG